MTTRGGSKINGSDFDAFQALVDNQEPISQIASASSSGALGAAEATALTVASTTYLANRAYAVFVEGSKNQSVGTAWCYARLRKTNTSGQVICDWTRQAAPGFSGVLMDMNLGRRVFTIGSTDVTAALVFTLETSSGTVTHNGSAQNPRIVSILDVGPAAGYPTNPILV